LNVPIAPGRSEDDYVAAFERLVVPAVDRFRPECLLVSAGFDAHRDDPLGGLRLTESGFARLTGMICELADRHCQGRVISALEGGYNLPALQGSVAAHVRAMG
jgi:acetoin utilization deacetylase AcuC-like enzyme